MQEQQDNVHLINDNTL